MDYVVDPASRDWQSFDMGAEAPARLLRDLLPSGYTSAYSIDIAEFPVGGYSAEHVDDGHAFYIISGQAEMVIGGKAMLAAGGQIAAIPGGVPHSIRNVGGEPLVMLTIYDPPRQRPKG